MTDISQLDQLLKFLTETLQQGKDFSLEQAPQFVRELLAWKFYASAIYACLVCLLAIVTSEIVGPFLRQQLTYDNETEAGDRVVRAVRWCAAFVAIIGIAVNVSVMVKVKVAPRVVLVEMVRDLIAPRR